MKTADKMRYALRRPGLSLILFATITGIQFASAQVREASTRPSTMETVLISADRSLYLPGDEMIITASVAEADTYQPSDLSRIVRVEVVSHDGVVIAREKIWTGEAGSGITVKLPEGMPTGWYQLRGYTNWMRNFPTSFYSSVNFRVINPSGLTSLKRNEETDTIEVTLYAQGQQLLLAGRENKCALFTADRYGNPVSWKGYLASAVGDSIPAETGLTGWGLISFTPREGIPYTMVPLNSSMTILNFSCPQIVTEAPVLTVLAGITDYKVGVEIPASAGLSECRLVVHSLYTWYFCSEITLTGGRAELTVPVSSLPESGLFQFTILDGSNNILTSKLLSPPVTAVTGGFIETEPGSPGLRESRVVSYSTGNGSNEGLYGIIARRKEPVERGEIYMPGLPGWPFTGDIPRQNTEFEAWKIAGRYGTEVIENIFGRGQYGKPVERVINFAETSSAREALIEYLPEITGTVITGRVAAGADGKPVANEPVTLTTFSDLFIYTAVTSPAGRFHFVVPDKRGTEDAVISFLRKPEEKWSVELIPDFDNAAGSSLPARVTLGNGEEEYIRMLWTGKQLTDIYSPRVLPDSSELHASAVKKKVSTLGYPDYSVYVDDFIRLPNMREVIAEVVPTVIARRKGDDWNLRLVNDQTSKDEMLPLILLDGLPLTWYNDFLQLPPERIRKIDVFTKIYVRGNATFGGAVSFISVNGDLAGLKLPGESRILRLKLPETMEWMAPQIKDLNIPMLRPTLGSCPFIRKGKGSFTFTAGDAPGEYVIILSGFSEGGNPVYLTHNVMVEPRRNQ